MQCDQSEFPYFFLRFLCLEMTCYKTWTRSWNKNYFTSTYRQYYFINISNGSSAGDLCFVQYAVVSLSASCRRNPPAGKEPIARCNIFKIQPPLCLDILHVNKKLPKVINITKSGHTGYIQNICVQGLGDTSTVPLANVHVQQEG